MSSRHLSLEARLVRLGEAASDTHTSAKRKRLQYFQWVDANRDTIGYNRPVCTRIRQGFVTCSGLKVTFQDVKQFLPFSKLAD